MRTRLLKIGITCGLALSLVAPVVFARSEADSKRIVVDIEGRGRIVIELHTKEAPKASGHIADLAAKGFYDGQKFFRVVREPRPFLVQVGDPNSRNGKLDDPEMGKGGSGTKVPYEDSGFKHRRGAVGLAHLPDDKNSGDSQFYIMLADHGFLDGTYTVFGQVTEGLDVLDKIKLGDRVTKVSVVD
ncbi:MAG: peptidylprolyl isomerase [Armatimonadetes bacterium]|nr:peptidylprolyl isomerase [Armatimonadota bacterium]